MKIKTHMIHHELRTRGIILRFLLGDFTPEKLRTMNWVLRQIKIPVWNRKIRVRQTWILRKDGSRMRICIFTPREHRGNLTGVLWLHGGGYAIGAPELAFSIAKKLITESPCVVVAPDYRLSIQEPYPAALEDSYTTLSWMKTHARELGVRENQLMVGGESAGGGLTAALTLFARDKGEVSIAFQMPLYPMLDDRMSGESAKDNLAPVWSSRSSYNAWKLYLGNLFEREDVPAYAAPSRAINFADLPPAATFVGDLEPFRDETIRYVEELRKAGVPVDFEVFHGCFHAFEQLCPKAQVSKKAVEFFLQSYRHAAANYFADQKSL
jgi:acetyl esterase/lipase